MRSIFKELKHRPGKELYLTDALSTLQSKEQAAEPTISGKEMKAHVDSFI